jgi:geranylgeranyl pyrophosphate synthase
MHERVEQVFAFIEELIVALHVPPSHQDLLQLHVRIGRGQAEAYPERPEVQLPLLVHAAITGDERPAIPVAGACTLLYLGADLFDNLIDHELPPEWSTRDPAEANLAASTMLAALPQLALARLREQGTSSARLWELSHRFAETLLTMSAGEHEDLLFAERWDVKPEMCETMIEHKGGSEFALFARAGAMLATEDIELIDKYAAFGLCLGAAWQIRSDILDIWKGQNSPDLLNGKRTLPIVYALDKLQGESRKRLQDLLIAVRDGSERHDEVQAMLLEAKSVHDTLLKIESYCGLARNQLAAASPREPAEQALRKLLAKASLLAPG